MKIALINMPFADVNRPALNLTQLKFRLDQKELGETSIHYLNQDFGNYFGLPLFSFMAANYTTGIGDWIFRKIAFPNVRDNPPKYLRRQFPQRDSDTRALMASILEKREGLADFLDSLIEKYELDKADIVGFTSMFSQNVACFAMAQCLKQRNPEVKIALGGANCETPMGEELVRNVDQVDYVFSGPALISFPAFVTAIGEGNTIELHQIKGLLTKENVDSLPKHMRVGEELPLDVPVELNYQTFLDAFNQHFPNYEGQKVLTFETSRGCWWGERSHCTFCGLNGDAMGYRAMSPEIALQQFEQIFEFADDFHSYACVDNILPRNYLSEVFPKLNPPDDIEIFYEVKADLKATDLALLSEKRVKSIQPGIEALSTKTLKLMRKGTSAAGNVAFLKNCAVHDLSPEWNLLVGFPGEPEDVFEKYCADIPKLLHLPPPQGCYPVRFDRYSPYFMNAEKYGLELKAYDFYRDVYPFDEDSINNMAYYFQNRDYGADFTRTMIRWIAQMQEGVQMWNHRWDHRWDQPGASPFPELYFEKKGDQTIIYDSRHATAQEHPVDAITWRVLDILTKPTAPSSLAKACSDLPDFDAEQTLKRLTEKELLFQEGNRYLSLVLPTKGHRLTKQRQFTQN